MQLDELLPENNSLQKMVSMSGMLNDGMGGGGDNLMGQPFGDDDVNGDPYFNQDPDQMQASYEPGYFDQFPQREEAPAHKIEELKQSEFIVVNTSHHNINQLASNRDHWMAKFIDPVEDVEMQDKDFVDDIDLFYSKPAAPQFPSMDEYEESKLEDIPYHDHLEESNQLKLAALNAFEQKITKFSDIILAKHQKK